jgi:hypothetical protein
LQQPIILNICLSTSSGFVRMNGKKSQVLIDI